MCRIRERIKSGMVEPPHDLEKSGGPDPRKSTGKPGNLTARPLYGGWQHLPYRGDPAFALWAPQGQQEPLLTISPEIAGCKHWQLGQPRACGRDPPSIRRKAPPFGGAQDSPEGCQW